MRRLMHAVVVALVAVPALVIGQGSDAARVLSAARQALAGDAKAAPVKTLAATGRTVRSRLDGSMSETEFEMSLELPDKFMKRELVVAMGPTSIYRNSGFNGDGLINVTDTPPALSAGGGVRMMAVHPGAGVPGQQIPKEQMEEINRKTLASIKHEYTRLALGMFATAPANFPVEFTYVGQAESKDGKADVLDVTGAGGFTARLFIDGTTHLPLMLSWKDKEPLVMTMGPGSGSQQMSAGGGSFQVITGGSGGRPMTPEDVAQMQREAEERMKEADAKRRIVEYQLFYADYKAFDGVKFPTRIQRTIEGKPAEEITFERIKVNPKIDAKKFEVNKDK